MRSLDKLRARLQQSMTSLENGLRKYVQGYLEGTVLLLRAQSSRYLNARGAHDRHRTSAKTESALVGICEEAKFGQRTTFDTLQAQPVLANARIALSLSAQTLKLNAPITAALNRIARGCMASR